MRLHKGLQLGFGLVQPRSCVGIALPQPDLEPLPRLGKLGDGGGLGDELRLTLGDPEADLGRIGDVRRA